MKNQPKKPAQKKSPPSTAKKAAQKATASKAVSTKSSSSKPSKSVSAQKKPTAAKPVQKAAQKPTAAKSAQKTNSAVQKKADAKKVIDENKLIEAVQAKINLLELVNDFILAEFINAGLPDAQAKALLARLDIKF